MCIHILLADDDPDDRQLFSEALLELPWSATLTAVSDGEEVLHLLNLEMEPPDVIFLDINMKRLNGICCLAEIKNHPRLAQLPVVVLSTSLDDNTISCLYQHGASYCMRKPDDFTKLKQLIDRALILITTASGSSCTQASFVLCV